MKYLKHNVGDIVEIKKTSTHNFEIGEMVKIVSEHDFNEGYDKDSSHYGAVSLSDDSKFWFIDDKDLEEIYKEEGKN